jgi:hypothetical protein
VDVNACPSTSEVSTAKEKRTEDRQRQLGRDRISTLEQRSWLFVFCFRSKLNTLSVIGRDNVISGILKATSPSDSAKSSAIAKSQIAYSVHDGRYKAGSPRTSVAPSDELFHPAVGHFLDDLK